MVLHLLALIYRKKKWHTPFSFTICCEVPDFLENIGACCNLMLFFMQDISSLGSNIYIGVKLYFRPLFCKKHGSNEWYGEKFSLVINTFMSFVITKSYRKATDIFCYFLKLLYCSRTYLLFCWSICHLQLIIFVHIYLCSWSLLKFPLIHHYITTVFYWLLFESVTIIDIIYYLL